MFLKNASKNAIGVLAFLGLAITLVAVGIAYAATTDTTAGKATAAAVNGGAGNQIVLYMPYTGDTDTNNNVYYAVKECRNAAYGSNVNVAHSASPYQITIGSLNANTCYDIRAAYNDAVVSGGSNVQLLRLTSTWDNTLLHNINRFAATNSSKWTSATNGAYNGLNGGWGVSATNGAYGQFTCNTCHTKSTTNIKRISTTITAANNTFPGGAVNFKTTSGTAGVTTDTFADDTGGHATSTKVCEICHSKNKYHDYNSANATDLTHNNAKDCTQCHPHDLGFFPAASCTSCHGDPPTVAAIGGPGGLASPQTGATNNGSAANGLGAHNAHVVGKGMNCEVCHTGYAMPSSAVQIGVVINSTTWPRWASANSITVADFNGHNSLYGAYNYRSSNAGTNVVANGTSYETSCDLYCHGGGTWANSGGKNMAASWIGGGNYKDCGACHGATASGAPNSWPTAVSHPQHTGPAAANQYSFACNTCHPTVANGDTNHITGTVAWQFDTTKAGASANYKNLGGSGNTGYPAQGAPYGNCTTVYCHSNGNPSAAGGNSTFASPTWGATISTCNVCHRVNENLAAMNTNPGGVAATNIPGMMSPRHQIHLAANGYNFMCDDCHANTAATNSNSALNGASAYTYHANGTKDVVFDSSYGTANNINQAGGNYTSNTCSNIYCHSRGTRRFISATNGPTAAAGNYTGPGIAAYNTAAWNGTLLGCDGCHGGPGQTAANNNIGAPNYPNDNGGANGYKANSHNRHVNVMGLQCNECHWETMGNLNGAINSYTAHNNGVYNISRFNGSITYTPGAVNIGTGAANGTPIGGQCSGTFGCHGAANWGGPPMTCVDCHSTNLNAPISASVGGENIRRSITTEFGLAYGHKKSGRGAVNGADCTVCHLEGAGNTATTNPNFHKNGYIDLRNPDGAGENRITDMGGKEYSFPEFSITYANGSRNSSGAAQNTVANILTQKFCLACHDSNGATNPTARSNNGGTPNQYMPFGGINLATGNAGANYWTKDGSAVNGGIVDVKSAFNTQNHSYHPVLGALNRDFPAGNRLVGAYNNNRSGVSGTYSLSVVLNCFDCHADVITSPATNKTIVAHGAANTIRGTIYAFNAVSTLCTTCHTPYTSTGNHGPGSAWSAVGSTHNVGRNCQDCHGTYQTTSARPARPIPAQDYHGNNSLNGGGLWPTTNSRPYAFIRAWGGTAYHKPRVSNEFTAGSAVCGTGTCPSGGNAGQVGDGSTRSYSAGGSY